MILSHKHRFIFIHCRKVAGSSIKVALGPHLGDDDIVIGSVHEMWNAGIRPNSATWRTLARPKPIAYTLSARLSGRSWAESINIGVKSHYRNKLSANPPHPSAAEIAAYFNEEWRSYKKFAFVRNPFHRVLSDYHWRQRSTGEKLTFSCYLELLQDSSRQSRIVHPGCRSNLDMISIDGKVAIDYVGRYENLAADFERITKELGVSGAQFLSHEKAAPHEYRVEDFYSEKEIAIVSELFKTELELFDYAFPAPQLH